MKISVIVNYHSEKALLVEALESVLNCDIFNIDIEILLVGDRPDETTQCLAEKFATEHSHLLKHLLTNDESGFGISSSRNLGVKEADGDVILFLDGDDLFYENKIAAVASAFISNPEVGFIYHRYDKFMDKSASFVKDNIGFWKSDTLKKYAAYRDIGMSTIAIRSIIAKKIKFQQFDACEDVDWIFQMFSALAHAELKVYKIEKSLSAYRIRERSRSAKKVDNFLIMYGMYTNKFGFLYGMPLLFVSVVTWTLNNLQRIFGKSLRVRCV